MQWPRTARNGEASFVTGRDQTEQDTENLFLEKRQDLKYTYRPDIRSRETLESTFREKFNALNHVTLTDGEFARLLEQLITRDTFGAAKMLRTKHTMLRDDGTPLDYTLVNVKGWCKNTFEVVDQLRMNTHSSHHRCDVLLLINGVPVVQVELKNQVVVPRKALERIVTYKKDAGNGYGHSLLCFPQGFVVNNRSSTYYFANNNAEHLSSWRVLNSSTSRVPCRGTRPSRSPKAACSSGQKSSTSFCTSSSSTAT